MVFFNNNGEILMAKCIGIDYIIINNNTKNCYSDIPVEIELNGRNTTAFLTDSGIIKLYSEKSDCEKERIIQMQIKNKY